MKFNIERAKPTFKHLNKLTNQGQTFVFEGHLDWGVYMIGEQSTSDVTGSGINRVVIELKSGTVSKLSHLYDDYNAIPVDCEISCKV